jgi:integrase/recombinase XerD
MKLSEAVEVFLDAKMADGLALTTIGWYRQRLTRLTRYLDDCDLGAVDAMSLRRFLVSLRAQKVLYQQHPYREQEERELSPATRNGYVRAMRTFFRWLTKEGCLGENPVENIKLPRLPRTPPKDVTPETLAALLRATAGDSPGQLRDRALILFLADTGCRVGGLVGLRRRDLDLGERVAVVTEKGDKSRPVMFMATTAHALKAYLNGRGIDSEWVFPSLKTGERMAATSVNHILARVRARAGLDGERCNPHAFRHAFARQYILNGGDLATLSDILGHADITVTKSFYSKFQFRELQAKHRQYSPVAALDLGQAGE